MIPGEYKLSDEKVPYNVGYEAISLEVKNVGDRAVQVGSHYHFDEANGGGLRFERNKAVGKGGCAWNARQPLARDWIFRRELPSGLDLAKRER